MRLPRAARACRSHIEFLSCQDTPSCPCVIQPLYGIAVTSGRQDANKEPTGVRCVFDRDHGLPEFYRLVVAGRAGPAGPVFWSSRLTRLFRPVALVVGDGRSRWVSRAAQRAGIPRISGIRPMRSFVPGGTRLVSCPCFPVMNHWAMIFRPPGWGRQAMKNFCAVLDSCTTYGRRETSSYE